MPVDLRKATLLLRHAMLNSNDNESVAALGRVARHLLTSGVDPHDLELKLVPTSRQTEAHTSSLHETVRDLSAENSALRRLLDEAKLKEFLRTRKIVWKWGEFEDLAQARFAPRRKPDAKWRARAAAALNLPITQLRRWERGIEEVPDDILDELRDLPERDEVAREADERRAARASGGADASPAVVARAIIVLGRMRKAQVAAFAFRLAHFAEPLRASWRPKEDGARDIVGKLMKLLDDDRAAALMEDFAVAAERGRLDLSDEVDASSSA